MLRRNTLVALILLVYIGVSPHIVHSISEHAYTVNYTATTEKPIYYVEIHGTTNITGKLAITNNTVNFTFDINSDRFISKPKTTPISTLYNVSFNGTITFNGNNAGVTRLF